MMTSEQEYDNVIGPMLLEIAKRCEALGMSIVARVELKSGNCAITQIGVKGASPAQELTLHAASTKWLLLR